MLHFQRTSRMHLCFPMIFRTRANASEDTDPNIIPVNNFSAHWIREIKIKRLTDNLQIIPTFPIDIYRYSDSVLKYMPKDTPKAFENHLMYSKEKVDMSTRNDRQDKNTTINIKPTLI